MKQSFTTGFSFGLTSGVITTLGLMVGLHAGTHSRLAVIGGIVTIAVADALSDALGIHIAEESKNNGNVSEIWESTIATFLAKFLIALTFVVPVLLLPLEEAMTVSVGWGLSLLAVLSYFLARAQQIPAWKVIAEHLVIGVSVIAITHYVGDCDSFDVERSLWCNHPSSHTFPWRSALNPACRPMREGLVCSPATRFARPPISKCRWWQCPCCTGAGTFFSALMRTVSKARSRSPGRSMISRN